MNRESSLGVVAERAREDLAADTRVGRFVVTRRLGAGATGAVYEAEDPELHRRVALKLLHHPDHDDSLRLLREAQALARVQHPCVVVIHDVGVTGQGVFIAMELVDGGTLRDLVEAGPLPWRRAVHLYAQAGRGLAAAHARGIIHRDFKPANVLVDTADRVRVTDFGLARFSSEVASSAPSSFTASSMKDVTVDETGEISAHGAVSDSPARPELLGWLLTHEGALLGTPRYMAPEQRARLAVTAASDQYAFCVSLWEAVFGAHPFPDGHEPSSVPTPTSRRAPRWLVRALTRGLAWEPARRYPSVAALVDELERAPRVRRRVAAAAAAVAVLAGGAIVLTGARSSANPCAAVPQLAGWDASARDAVHAAFAATKLPFAETAFAETARRLDDYATRWHAMRVDVCRATRVLATQPAITAERRDLCLDRRADDVAALVAALRHIPRDGVEKAVDTTGALGDLAACAENQSLARITPLPQDPARAAAIRGLEREVADAAADVQLRRGAELAPRVDALVTRARATGYAPLLVAALGLTRDLAVATDRWSDAARDAEEQLVAAEAAGEDDARFDVYVNLVSIYGASLQRFDDAAQRGHVAEGLLERLGNDPGRAAKLHCAMTHSLWAQGKFEPALGYAQQCVAEHERALPRDDERLGTALHRRAILHARLHHTAEALADDDRAIALVSPVLGRRSPRVGLMLNLRGALLEDKGDADGAEATLHEALSILEETRGETSEVASVLQDLANLYKDLDRPGDAIPLYRRRLAILEKSFGPTNNRVAETLDMLGLSLAMTGHYDEGEAAARRSLAIRETNGHASLPSDAIAHANFAKQYLLRGDLRHALAQHEAALAIREQVYGKDHPMLVGSLLAVAEVHLLQKRPDLARTHLERARRYLDAPEAEIVRARLQFALAQVLWPRPAERAAARAYADAALAAFRADEDDDRIADVEAWRRANGVQ
jgi:tRNA A-37 threonylcarbamoyl transferase component Bud32/tetratricopeptide (TPR) repeat protein